VISHGTTDDATPPMRHPAEQLAALYQGVAHPITPRSRAEIERFFDNWDLVDPGVVPTPKWRPSTPSGDEDPDTPGRRGNYAGVGRKGHVSSSLAIGERA
jgi:hypothetical protein